MSDEHADEPAERETRVSGADAGGAKKVPRKAAKKKSPANSDPSSAEPDERPAAASGESEIKDPENPPEAAESDSENGPKRVSARRISNKPHSSSNDEASSSDNDSADRGDGEPVAVISEPPGSDEKGGGNKRRRRRRKKGGQSEDSERDEAQGGNAGRSGVDPGKVARKAWRIYLAEVSEEGLALISDQDAKELTRRSFRLAEVFLEEAARRQ
jgi:hypothetical protein